jgi:hypothetical protein
MSRGVFHFLSATHCELQCFVAIQPRRQRPTRRSSWNAHIPSVYARAPSPLALPFARHPFSPYTDIRFPRRIGAVCLTSGSKQRLHAPATGPLCGPCARRTIHFAMHARGINPATFAPQLALSRGSSPLRLALCPRVPRVAPVFSTHSPIAGASTAQPVTPRTLHLCCVAICTVTLLFSIPLCLVRTRGYWNGCRRILRPCHYQRRTSRFHLSAVLLHLVSVLVPSSGARLRTLTKLTHVLISHLRDFLTRSESD